MQHLSPSDEFWGGTTIGSALCISPALCASGAGVFFQMGSGKSTPRALFFEVLLARFRTASARSSVQLGLPTQRSSAIAARRRRRKVVQAAAACVN